MAAKPIKQRYVQITDRLYNSEAFRTLPGAAMKLWVDVRTSYFGVNNGRLVITLATLRKRGWNSTDKLLRARDELLKRGLIFRTRHCGKNAYQRASWYAFSDLPVSKDDKNGIAGGPASHAYSNWTSPVRAFRKQDKHSSGNRKEALPDSGQPTGQTLPDLGKQQIALKGAPALGFAPFSEERARFPISGYTNICSTNLSAVSGTHLTADVKSGTNGQAIDPLASDQRDQKKLMPATEKTGRPISPRTRDDV